MPKLSKDSPDIGTTDKMKIVGEMWQKQKREKEAGKHTKSKIQSKSKNLLNQKNQVIKKVAKKIVIEF